MAAGSRPPWRRVDGVLLLDKPSGVSSNAALQRVRRAFRAQKAGHTGTLDPLASGLLPVCFGDATKFAQGLLDAPKAYRATVAFGAGTTTGDAEGEVIAQGPVPEHADAIATTLTRFLGAQTQVPPRHAALKHQGRKYYEYARAGIEIPRAARTITIEAIDLVAWDAPHAVIDVRCSKGTYVRTLAEDVAAALGTVGHLAGLRRTATGPFTLDGAHALDAIEAASEEARVLWLLPSDAPLAGMPRLAIAAADVLALVQGRRAGAPPDLVGRVAAYGPDRRFVGVAEARAGVLAAVRLVRTDDLHEDGAGT